MRNATTIGLVCDISHHNTCSYNSSKNLSPHPLPQIANKFSTGRMVTMTYLHNECLMLLNSSRRCNCLVIFFVNFFFKFSIWCCLVHVSSLLTYIHYNYNMGGRHRWLYCFSGSPSLTCISLKCDVYVYL